MGSDIRTRRVVEKLLDGIRTISSVVGSEKGPLSEETVRKVHGICAQLLIIGGWVAMWRPMEIFIYEWWPLMRTGRLYEKLSRMRVEVRKRNQ
jgi:hypothetical protein